MNAIKVRKCAELRGRDPKDLEKRVDVLRQAIRRQSGAILDIKWSQEGSTTAQTASVLYHVPFGAEVEMSAP